MGLGRGDPPVLFPCSCLVHPEPRVTVGARAASSRPLCPGCDSGRCWCDLAAVKETPVCVCPSRESSFSYPVTQTISPWRGVAAGKRTAREGLAGFGEGDRGRQGGGAVSADTRNGRWEVGGWTPPESRE